MRVLEAGWERLLLPEETVYLPEGVAGSMVLMPRGAVQAGFDGAVFTVQDGDALLMRPGTPLRLSAQEPLFYGWVQYDAGSDESFVQALHLPENALLRFTDSAFLPGVLQQITAEFYAAGAHRAEMLENLLRVLLIRLSACGGQVSTQAVAASDPHYAALVRLREKIYANPQEKWTVEMLCSEVNMSRSYFQLIYRETFGMTCIADVIHCKMNRARDLLTSTSYTISHIAQLCGYDNEEHFMRQFKKNNGVTPTVFRREHKFNA